MYNEFVSVVSLLKAVYLHKIYKLQQKKYQKIDLFVYYNQWFTALKNEQYFRRQIKQLHSCFEVLFIAKSTFKVSINGVKVSVVHLKEISVL